MRIRDISDADLGTVRDLLVEGFPMRSRRYWTTGLENLRTRSVPEGFPRYGQLIEVEGVIQGVILLITSCPPGRQVRTNLSSWYVRDGFRQYATFLLRNALRLKSTTFWNTSPADHVLPIMTAMGFEPYTSGMAVLDLRNAAGRANRRSEVRRISSGDCATLPQPAADVARAHLAYGCSALWLRAPEREGLLVHRRRLVRRFVPAEQIIFADRDLLEAVSKQVMRAFVARGSVLALYDVERNGAEGLGRFVHRGLRYSRGGAPPDPGDLLESELAVLGP